jgi:DNA-binding transcriptional regulator YiaG
VRVLVQVREPVLGAAQEMETGRAMATASRCQMATCPPQGHHHRKRTTRTTLPAHRAVYSCSTPYMGAGRHRSARAKANRDEAALASTKSGARGGGRRVQSLEAALKAIRRPSALERPAPTDRAPTKATRFSAKSLKSQRGRLGISAADVGLLIGTTGQAIYNWEGGQARPRAAHLEAIAALRKLGRKQAAAIVAERR